MALKLVSRSTLLSCQIMLMCKAIEVTVQKKRWHELFLFSVT